MGVDVFDIVAVIFGILFTIRKLDAQSRRAEEFPHVDEARFAEWQRREVRIYSQAVLACFLKVFLDLGFVYFVAPGLPTSVARAVGAGIDLSWLAFVIATFVRGARVAKYRRSLGILLGGFVVEEKRRPRSDESDPADESR